MLRTIELFSGVGSQTQALKNIALPHKVVAISDIDKFADQSYRALHNENVLNLGDISKIEKLPPADLWTYSFPCQDISVAGTQKGFDKGNHTRSGLLWEVERLLLQAQAENTLPQYLLLENVKNLVGKQHKANYDKWIAFLNELGYSNYWQVLNAKDYGVPQNRERVFCISILGNHQLYTFPAKQELTIRLKDILDEEVDEKFYLKETTVQGMLNSTFSQRRDRIMVGRDISLALEARDYHEPKCVAIQQSMFYNPYNDAQLHDIAPTQTTGCGSITSSATVLKITHEPAQIKIAGQLTEPPWDKAHNMHKQVFNPEGISPALTAGGGGNLEKKIIVAGEVTEGKWGKMHDISRRVYDPQGLAPALHTAGGGNTEPKIVAFRGRTPKNPTQDDKFEQRAEMREDGMTNTITTVQKDNMVAVLVPKRTEYGKAIRTQYERGEITEQRKNMTKLEPRQDGISNTLTTVQKDNMILQIKSGTKRGYEEAREGDAINFAFANSETRRGRVGKQVAQTLDTACTQAAVVQAENLRIRKLTPTECWRLMGWRDDQIAKVKDAGVSNSQMYKQAGNGIVVTVLEAIFTNLFLRGKP